MPAPPVIADLVDRFEQQGDAYKSGQYNEAQLRKEFVDPMFKALGWDMENISGYAEAYKDVIHEDAIRIGGAIKELDDIILTRDLPEQGLRAGDIGTVVLVHRNNAGYEVEFTSLDGETIAVITLMADQVRAAEAGEIAHVRSLAAA